MFSKKSLRGKFALQLVLTSSVLIAIFSTIFYNYITILIYEDLKIELVKKAEKIVIKYNFSAENVEDKFLIDHSFFDKDNLKIVIYENRKHKPFFRKYRKNSDKFLTIYYPVDIEKSTFLSITKNISNKDKLLRKIFHTITVINFITFFLVLLYTYILSRMLISPIRSLTQKLTAMDENFSRSIDTANIPEEFQPLALSINRLTKRISTFVKYQKELFIGIAHELKTPLAVMKTTNEVTLIVQRDTQRYIDTLQHNNKTIDEMNKMIGCVLEIGRLEGAQFEQPVEIDLIEFLKERANSFEILVHLGKKIFIKSFSPGSFPIVIQPTLLIHILQNFIQNAIKFTSKGGKVEIKSFTHSGGINIQVIDDGIGIDENQDLFAPFKRYGKKEGAGLGLFLAKGAADAIGATIDIQNRKDKSGTIATLHIPISNRKPAQKVKKCDL